MQNTSAEMALLEPEEKEMIQYIWEAIPVEDRANMTMDDVLFVLDEMDNYLEEVGLMVVDEKTEEVTYLEGDVDETAQLEYVLNAVKDNHRSISSVQVQLIMDAEMSYGIEQGYYDDID